MAKERQAFQSTYLHWGEYDPTTQSLTLSFSSGATLTSHPSVKVPQSAWDGLKAANGRGESAGGYFHANIKPFWMGVDETTGEEPE